MPNVFERNEIKFMLSPQQYGAAMKEITNHMKVDDYGETTIQSLYYDTPNYELVRLSNEKPVFKEKIRVRSYGLAKSDSNVFLELKRKYSGIVYKRRVVISQGKCNNFFGTGKLDGGQIEKELGMFYLQHKGLVPKVLILYDRTAYFGIDDLRVTFDRNIRYRTKALNLTTNLDGIPLVESGYVLMEVKTGTAFPLWLVQLLSQNNIYKTSFSKYGTAYGLITKDKTKQHSEVI